MLVILNAMIIILFIVLFIWTWNSLGENEKKQKVLYIVIGSIVVYIITKIILAISASSVVYPNEEIAKQVGNILASIFTPINGFILLPQIAKWREELNKKEISKAKFKQKLFILFIIFIAIIFLESSYLTDTQIGIINIGNTIE